MTRLVREAKPEQFVSYNSLKVAFFDAKNPDYNPKYHDPSSPEFKEQFRNFPQNLLYAHILLGNDDRSVIIRAAGTVKIPDGNGGTKIVQEIEAYKRAYELYLKAKELPEEKDLELEKLRAENEEFRKKQSETGQKSEPKSPKKPIEEGIVKKLSEK